MVILLKLLLRLPKLNARDGGPDLWLIARLGAEGLAPRVDLVERADLVDRADLIERAGDGALLERLDRADLVERFVLMERFDLVERAGDGALDPRSI